MAKKTTAKRSYQLDLMATLEAADRRMFPYYDNLTEQERKAFAPLVIQRWLSALGDNNPNQAYQILAMNDLVNVGLFQIQSQHPELVWKLMCVAGTGRKQAHQWIPNKKSMGTTPTLDAWIRSESPHVNSQELQIIRNSRSEQQWCDLLKSSGASDAQIKDIRTELKKLSQSDKSE